MKSVEDQIRAATRAQAEALREVGPLRLPPAPASAPADPAAPPRRARRFRLWIAPVTAAAAVIALAISLVLIRDIPNGPVVPAVKPTPSGAVPAHYVALFAPPHSRGALTQAVVRDTFTGAAVTSVSVPAGDTWLAVAAAADDRTFVLAAAPVAKPPFPATNNGPAAWYELQLSGSGKATLRKLPIPATPGASYLEGLALSPDGTKLAALVYQVSRNEAAVLRVYSVATGAVLHTWSAPTTLRWFQESGVSWLADGNRLAFSYWWRSGPSASVSVRTLRVTGSGSNLIADSRLAWSTPLPYQDKAFPFGCSTIGRLPVLTMDGTAVVCSAATGADLFEQPGKTLCPAGPPATELGFLQVPTAAGQPARTLYRDDSSCVPNGNVPIETLWTSPSGDAVIGYLAYGEPPATTGAILRFGVFSHGTFRPLPVPPQLQVNVTYTPYTVAW